MSQTLKPVTAANKLGIYLPAAPKEFRNTPITRDELKDLRDDPPAWLSELLSNGPFPRQVMAKKLGVSRSGLARAGIKDGLTADELDELIADPPAWLVAERETHRKVKEEKARLRREQAS